MSVLFDAAACSREGWLDKNTEGHNYDTPLDFHRALGTSEASTHGPGTCAHVYVINERSISR